MRVAVFYVWVPGEEFKAHTERFARAYKRHPAGAEHDLVLLCKADVLPRSHPGVPATQVVAVGEHGYDIGPFLELAQGSDHDRVVLLGSYARPLIDGWLGKLTAAGRLCSATGSYEQRPHLRSTCLSVDPVLLEGMPGCVSKEDCWAFEHGERSVYEHCRAQGVQGLVVGADGVYGELDWPTSRTYRAGAQVNLICADNHTDAYEQAAPERRSELERDAWGARAGHGRAPITVLTVTIAGRATVQATIESVYAQTVPVARQLLVAHHPAATRELAQVQYSTAKNELLALVDTDWVAVLNDDDQWLEHHVQTVLGELEQADVVYSWDAGGTRPRQNCNDWPAARIAQALERGNFIDGNCLIRTEALRDVGGFPVDWVPAAGGRGGGAYKDSPAGFEDWELWRRLVRAGARFRCVPKETWRYGVSANGRLSA